MYEYKAEIVRVIDGDTVVARIDLGFDTSTEQVLRLHGIDAPEIRGSHLTPEQREAGDESTEYLKGLLEGYKPLTVRTLKDRTGKFGRYLAVLYGTDAGDPIDINTTMVADGHAVAT